MRVLKEAVTKLERQLGERVRVARSDGGADFGCGEAIDWYRVVLQEFSTTFPRDASGTQRSGPKGW
jgi:hypothetical protein